MNHENTKEKKHEKEEVEFFVLSKFRAFAVVISASLEYSNPPVLQYSA